MLGARAARAGRHTAKIAERAAVDFFADRCTQIAAAISYYALFAVFPVAILAVTVFGVVIGEDQARQDVLDFLTEQLPVTDDGGRQDLSDLLQGVVANSGTFGLIALAGLAISATGLMGAVRHGLNTVWDIEDRRAPLHGKAVDLLLVIGVGIVFAASFAVSVVRSVARDVAEDVDEAIGIAAPTLVDAGTWLAPLLLSFAVFVFLFHFIPATDVRWRDAAVGAAFVTGGYELAKVVFGYYLENIADYGAVYGALGAVIAFVFFVFVVANIFLLGAEIAAERPRVLAGCYDPPDDREDDDRGTREKLRGALRGLVVTDRDR